MTFRRLIGGAMPNADAIDSVFSHPPAQQSRRVFLTRRDSGNVLQRVKELVASGQFEPVVAREHDNGERTAPMRPDRADAAAATRRSFM
jgi:hypothetical protein